MSKLKSHSGAKKRLKKTASGKFVAKKAGRSHNLSSKSRSRMRRLEKGLVVHGVEQNRAKALLPHA